MFRYYHFGGAIRNSDYKSQYRMTHAFQFRRQSAAIYSETKRERES